MNALYWLINEPKQKVHFGWEMAVSSFLLLVTDKFPTYLDILWDIDEVYQH